MEAFLKVELSLEGYVITGATPSSFKSAEEFFCKNYGRLVSLLMKDPHSSKF